MPNKCTKMTAFMGLSAASVALHGSWYEPSKVPTLVNPYIHPRNKTRPKEAANGQMQIKQIQETHIKVQADNFPGELQISEGYRI